MQIPSECESPRVQSCPAALVHAGARVSEMFRRVCIMLCVSVCIPTFEPSIFMISVHAPPPHSGTSVILQNTCSLRESTSSSYDLSVFALRGVKSTTIFLGLFPKRCFCILDDTYRGDITRQLEDIILLSRGDNNILRTSGASE